MNRIWYFPVQSNCLPFRMFAFWILKRDILIISVTVLFICVLSSVEWRRPWWLAPRRFVYLADISWFLSFSHIFPFSPLPRFSDPCRPSSLCLHRYASLLFGACVRVDTHGPGGAGLRGRLPLSPESLWRLRHIRYMWWDPPATDLGGRGRGGHGGSHGAAAAAVEALGRFQPGEHGQRVREVGGRRWCVGWGAHLRRKRERTKNND